MTSTNFTVFCERRARDRESPSGTESSFDLNEQRLDGPHCALRSRGARLPWRYFLFSGALVLRARGYTSEALEIATATPDRASSVLMEMSAQLLVPDSLFRAQRIRGQRTARSLAVLARVQLLFAQTVLKM